MKEAVYMSPSQLARVFSMDRSTVHRRIKGIQKQIDAGRYGKYSIVGNKVHKAVFLDFEKYGVLLDGVGKNVPPFDIRETDGYL